MRHSFEFGLLPLPFEHVSVREYFLTIPMHLVVSKLALIVVPAFEEGPAEAVHALVRKLALLYLSVDFGDLPTNSKGFSIFIDLAFVVVVGCKVIS